MASKPRLRFQSSSWRTFDDAGFQPSDLLFCGDPVDDRGREAVKSLSDLARHTAKLTFDPELNHILVDGNVQSISQIASLCTGAKRIRIESTTLGLAEILKVIQAARQADIDELEFIYIEPKDYTVVARSAGEFLNPRDFELTDNRVFRAVHGFAHSRGSNAQECYVFFLGYEASRLVQAFEQPQLQVDHRYAIFGVPPFSPEWETNALGNHVADLRNLGFASNSILYCSANSCREAYLTLWDLYAQLGHEHLTFVVSPLGTKPHAVAAALFLVETKGSPFTTALYYDHPKRRVGRSREVRRWHLSTVRGLRT
jgi:hypothetical protein